MTAEVSWGWGLPANCESFLRPVLTTPPIPSYCVKPVVAYLPFALRSDLDLTLSIPYEQSGTVITSEQICSYYEHYC